MKKWKIYKPLVRRVTMEEGVSLDVPGAALVEQATERIEWHRRNAEEMTAVGCVFARFAGVRRVCRTTDLTSGAARPPRVDAGAGSWRATQARR
jgi:hypothetical protein